MNKIIHGISYSLGSAVLDVYNAVKVRHVYKMNIQSGNKKLGKKKY